MKHKIQNQYKLRIVKLQQIYLNLIPNTYYLVNMDIVNMGTYYFIRSHLSSKLNYHTVAVLTSLIFPFHALPSLVHSAGFSFYIFPGVLAIFILLSSNNNNIVSHVCLACLLRCDVNWANVAGCVVSVIVGVSVCASNKQECYVLGCLQFVRQTHFSSNLILSSCFRPIHFVQP